MVEDDGEGYGGAAAISEREGYGAPGSSSENGGEGYGAAASSSEHEDEVHIGLHNVSERLALMCNGRLEILARPGGGTCVRIIIPA